MKKGIVALAIVIALSVPVYSLSWAGADEVTEYYCPKCGSVDISRVCTDPVVVRKSMDQIPEDPWYAVMQYTNMKAVCNQCGYEVKYTIPR